MQKILDNFLSNKSCHYYHIHIFLLVHDVINLGHALTQEAPALKALKFTIFIYTVYSV